MIFVGKRRSVEEVDPTGKYTLVEKEVLVETGNPVSKEPVKEMDVPVKIKRVKWNTESPTKEVEEGTTITGRKIRKPDQLVEQWTVALSGIGYSTLPGLLSGHEYTEGEICAMGIKIIGGFKNIK